MFGFLCSFPYVVIGAANGGIRNGLYAGFAYWIAGIPFDVIHGISNFIIMTALYIPVSNILERVVRVKDSNR
jgi:energy-coupling factor transport system substrate-specific component